MGRQYTNKEYRDYVKYNILPKFRENRESDDEHWIRAQIKSLSDSIKVAEAYNDPLPKKINDHYRVLRMGAGYSKGGKEHQNYATRFRSHIKRLESHKKQRDKVKPSRKASDLEGRGA